MPGRWGVSHKAGEGETCKGVVKRLPANMFRKKGRGGEPPPAGSRHA